MKQINIDKINIGDQYNYFTVIDKVNIKGKGKLLDCRCVCGNVRKIKYYDLIHNEHKSCGCINNLYSNLPIGNEYNRLTIIDKVKDYRNRTAYKCKCSCGNIKVIPGRELIIGRVKSCGCFNKENVSNKTHGASYTTEFKIWAGMIQRCTNPNNPGYYNYGGRGISVCSSWLKFENFFEDMKSRPSRKHSLDRRNNNEGYCKSNCRWATATEQANNTRKNIYIEYKGKKQLAKQWSIELNIPYSTIMGRYYKDLPTEDILSLTSLSTRKKLK